MENGKDKRKRRTLQIRSDEDDRKIFTKFVLYLTRGKNRAEITRALKISEDKFDLLFAQYYEESEQEQQAKTPLRIFTELVGRKNQLVRDLERLKEALMGERLKSPQAYVAAVRAQSDILDSLLKIGQNLGLIVKTPDQVLLVGGRDARELNSDDLEHSIQNEMNEIRQILDDSGGSKKTAEIVTFPAMGNMDK
jgi:hypothetical protein